MIVAGVAGAGAWDALSKKPQTQGRTPITATTGKGGETLGDGYHPGNINLADSLYHPPEGDRRAIFAEWQGRDITVTKLLGLAENGPNEAAASALQLIAAMISCKFPPDGGQVPLYFSDVQLLRDQFSVGDSYQFREGSPGGLSDWGDQVLVYDTLVDPATFGQGVDADGNPTLKLIAGTLCFQRKHGGNWQTLDGRDPAKAQLVKSLSIGYQQSQDGSTFTVRSFAMDPGFEDFLTRLRA